MQRWDDKRVFGIEMEDESMNYQGNLFRNGRAWIRRRHVRFFLAFSHVLLPIYFLLSLNVACCGSGSWLDPRQGVSFVACFFTYTPIALSRPQQTQFHH
jgi:hypothetical protein